MVSSLVLFNAFNAERLPRGISLYQLLSDWLHRTRPFSNKEPTTYEADALSTKPLQLRHCGIYRNQIYKDSLGSPKGFETESFGYTIFEHGQIKAIY